MPSETTVATNTGTNSMTIGKPISFSPIDVGELLLTTNALLFATQAMTNEDVTEIHNRINANIYVT
jgi:hypothetical protein